MSSELEALRRALRGEQLSSISQELGYNRADLENLYEQYRGGASILPLENAFLSCAPDLLEEQLRSVTNGGPDVSSQLDRMIAGDADEKDRASLIVFGNWLHTQSIVGKHYRLPLGAFLSHSFNKIDRAPTETRGELLAQLANGLRRLRVGEDADHTGPILQELLPEKLISMNRELHERQDVEAESTGVAQWWTREQTPNPGPVTVRQTHFVLYGNSWWNILLWYHASAYTRTREGIVLEQGGQTFFEIHWPWSVDTISAAVVEWGSCAFLWPPQAGGRAYKVKASDAECSTDLPILWFWDWAVQSQHGFTNPGYFFNKQYYDGHWKGG